LVRPWGSEGAAARLVPDGQTRLAAEYGQLACVGGLLGEQRLGSPAVLFGMRQVAITFIGGYVMKTKGGSFALHFRGLEITAGPGPGSNIWYDQIGLNKFAGTSM